MALFPKRTFALDASDLGASQEQSKKTKEDPSHFAEGFFHVSKTIFRFLTCKQFIPGENHDTTQYEQPDLRRKKKSA